MNQIVYLASLCGFLLLPILLLVMRMARPAFMRWWLFIVLLSVIGWLLVNTSFHFYYAHLDELLAQYDNNAPKELVDRRVGDGAKLVFARYFGWAYGPSYAIPWLILYALFQLARRGFKQRSA